MIHYLLDTNIVIGILKGDTQTKSILADTSAEISDYAVSQITRMELLSFPELQQNEEKAITRFLSSIQVIPLCEAVENRTITFRKHFRCKLPDAIIAATALHHGLSLITLDKALMETFDNAVKKQHKEQNR